MQRANSPSTEATARPPPPRLAIEDRVALLDIIILTLMNVLWPATLRTREAGCTRDMLEEYVTSRLDYNQAAPAGVKALGGVYGYILQSGLSEALVELVYLRISQINNCAFCLDMHTRALLKQGEPIEKLALVQAWKEAGSLFDDREKAGLAWAETVTRVAETRSEEDKSELQSLMRISYAGFGLKKKKIEQQ